MAAILATSPAGNVAEPGAGRSVVREIRVPAAGAVPADPADPRRGKLKRCGPRDPGEAVLLTVMRVPRPLRLWRTFV